MGVRRTKSWKVRCEKCGIVAKGIYYNVDANRIRSIHNRFCDGIARTVAR